MHKLEVCATTHFIGKCIMSEQFLYEQLDTLSNFGMLKKEMPDSITQNLHPVYELRPYQMEAFTRFIHCLNKDFPGKRNPLHLLFNMATGSGKTLIKLNSLPL